MFLDVTLLFLPSFSSFLASLVSPSPSPPPPPMCSLIGVRLNVQHGVQLLGRVAQQALQVTDESVHVALARRLVDDVLVVVVAQASTQLLVVHLGLVFPLAPPPGHL